MLARDGPRDAPDGALRRPWRAGGRAEGQRRPRPSVQRPARGGQGGARRRPGHLGDRADGVQLQRAHRQQRRVAPHRGRPDADRGARRLASARSMPGSRHRRQPRCARLGAVALAAALFLLTDSAAAAETDWTALRQIDIAHQGGEDEAPSNTMYAYERALRLGADMLEVDVHTTADGRLVVLHDGTVDRTTNGSGSVYDMTLKQARALDAAYNFVPGESAQSGRPAADYVFRGVRTGKREPPPGFKRRDFRITTLGEVMHQLAPEIDMAPAVGAVAAYKFGHVPPPEGTVAFQVPTEFEGVTVTDREFVERAHGDGYAVHVWTINDEQTMRQLLGWGTDGI